MQQDNTVLPKVISWATFRKSVPQLFHTWDSSKPWSRMTVSPTMLHYGFKSWLGNDIEFDKRKPKDIVLQDFKHIISDASEVVYFVSVPTGNYAGYYKYLDIFYKTIDHG